MTTITGTTPDVSTLVQGIEQRDAAAVAAWYAEDATFTWSTATTRRRTRRCSAGPRRSPSCSPRCARAT